MSADKTKEPSERYIELVREFPLRRLRDDDDLERATALIEALIERPKLTRGEGEYLDVLADLVVAYEDKQYPLVRVSEAEMLRFLLESRGVTQAEAAAQTGIAESSLSSLLSGRRRMTKTHIEAFCSYFKVGPSAFISTEK